MKNEARFVQLMSRESALRLLSVSPMAFHDSPVLMNPAQVWLTDIDAYKAVCSVFNYIKPIN